MNVLSLFDGISCLQIALERAKMPITNYYASEINKNSIKVTQTNYPNTIQLGDINNIHFANESIQLIGESKLTISDKIDLIGAGSPCQDISNLNQKKQGLKGSKSSLFYKFLEAKEAFPNAYYLLENVSGTDSKLITKELKRRPMRLDSNWIVPQNRNRLYWTNIPVNSLPKRVIIKLTDILESDVPERFYQKENWLTWWLANKDFQLEKGYSTLNANRAGCLTARMYASWNGNFIQDAKGIRRLTTVECERLQTIPDGYTSCISDKWAYHALGDCWTVDIIVHILKHIK
jgi:site-specific DNA-cytosine methylase